MTPVTIDYFIVERFGAQPRGAVTATVKTKEHLC